MARLAAQRDGLGPAEDLLDQLPLPLADRIAAVPGLYPTWSIGVGITPFGARPIPIRGGERTTNGAFRRSGNEADGQGFAFLKDSRSWPRGGTGRPATR